MAKLFRGILGVPRGTIGTLEFNLRHGVGIVKNALRVFKSPLSPATTITREKFSKLSAFLQLIYFDFIKDKLRPVSGKATDWYKFYKLNLSKFDESNNLDVLNLTMSLGVLTPNVMSSGFYYDNYYGYRCKWLDVPLNSSSSDSDKVSLLVYNQTLDKMTFTLNQSVRGDNQQDIDFEWQSSFYHNVYVLIMFSNASSGAVSSSWFKKI